MALSVGGRKNDSLHFIDRRFYRKKHDALQVLNRFAQTARDETNIDLLSSELLRIVEDEMQPEGLTVWMKK